MTTSVLVTGGAGYLGSVLVPKLLERHRVVILDAMWFLGPESEPRPHPRLRVVRGDLRDETLVRRLLDEERVDVVIHLAAISNDPCSDLDAELTRSINLVATEALMVASKAAGVRRFINASSASVYGIKEDADVTEDLALEPLTLYSRYKVETEAILDGLTDRSFCGTSIRAATVCGYSPRLRLDLTINILSYHALVRGEIRVFGGDQMRPNVHIHDLTDVYAMMVDVDPAKIRKRAFNIATEDASVLELAHMVRDEVDPDLPIRVVSTKDERSYRLSSRRAREELGFRPRRALAEAVGELRSAFSDGRVGDPDDPIYRNVELMKRHPERVQRSGGEV